MTFLSYRLKAIFEMIPRGEVVADVGADHGKLVIALIEKDIVKKAYAIENKKGPFAHLLYEIGRRNLSSKIVAIFSNGISILPEVSVLVLAGMGGKNIIDILSSHKENLKNINTIIVDPHNAISKVREYISSIGFVISEEKIIFEDNIFYEIIKFIRSDHDIYSSEDYEFGPILRENKCLLFIKKYENRLNEINLILKTKKIPETRINELLAEKNRIEKQLCKQKNYY